MKKFHSLAVCLGFISFLLLFSCDVLEVTEEFTYDLEYAVKSDTNYFYDEMLLDPWEEGDDFETAEDKMETAELIKIEYTVTYFNGPVDQVLLLAEWKIADSLGNDPQVLCSISNMNLQSLTSQIVELPIDPAGLSKFNQMIDDANYITLISLNGQTNGAPIDFKLKFWVTVKVTGHII